MKRFYKSLLAMVLVLLVSVSAKAIGWPANYQGVMLQSFWWDSYQESTAKPYKATTWANLEAQADELSQYFKLIWVPNSGKSTGGLGYMPIYWFTNHNSSMGNEAALKSMIQTYKEKGVGMIADVVINHRAGRTNWTDFPAETWNGVTYQIGLDGICRNDEVNNPGNPGGATGAYDEGENFDGARDLDHTNANVQLNCKNYCKCLLEKYGYVGFRLDMVKGYSGYYTKMYNQYAKPTYSVGEYWDGSYDTLAKWIEDTGRESAAFDFALKYRINEAFHGNNFAELAWQSPSDGLQPAGLIHYGYQQLAVTFVDNHDTYRDGSKFNGDVVAANAFILCSPGTPCVFMPHYNQYKSAIQRLINIRNSCGVTNTSKVKVLKSDRNCYMAEVYGSKGTLVVKIGPSMDSPSGYSDSDIKASGNLYCVWTKASVSGGNTGGGSDPVVTPSKPDNLYLVGNVNGQNWSTSQAVRNNSASNGVYTWNSVAIAAADSKATYGYFSFLTSTGADWDAVNEYDRYGAATEDEVLNGSATISAYPANVSASGALSWAIAPGNYKVVADLNTMKVTVTNLGGSIPTPNPDPDPNPNPNPDPNPGSGFTVYFRNNVGWNVPWIHYWGGASASSWPGVAMTKVEGDVWKQDLPAGTTGILFHPDDNPEWKTKDLTAVANHIYEFGSTSGQGTDCGVYSGATGGGGGGETPVTPPTPGEYPAKVYLVGDAINGQSWATSTGVQPDAASNGVYTWNSVVFGGAPDYTYFQFATVLDAADCEWDGINQGDRYGAPAKDTPVAAGTPSSVRRYAYMVDAMGCEAWMAQPGTYKVVLDLAKMTVTLSAGQGGGGGNTDPTPDPGPVPGDYPSTIYVVGNLNGMHWASAHGIEPNTKDNGIYTWNNLKFESADADTPGVPSYFTFLTALDAMDGEWDGANQADRYGAPTADYQMTVGTAAPVRLYANQVDAMGAESWAVTPGTYNLVLNLRDMTVTTYDPAGVEGVSVDANAPAEYYTLQGIRVAQPAPGNIYIVRRGTKASKVYVK